MYVTHDQTEAMTMGDRIAIPDGGELQQLGTPLECYTVSEKFLCTIWPPVAQRLTTDSILRAGERLRRGLHRRPSMNFFELEREGNRLVGDAIEFVPTDEQRARIGEEEVVTLGIRPEDATLVDEAGPNTYTGTVEVVEPMGDVNQLLVDLGGIDTTVTVEGDLRIEEGNRLRIRFPEDRVHLFDTADGTAIAHREASRNEPPAAVVGYRSKTYERRRPRLLDSPTRTVRTALNRVSLPGRSGRSRRSRPTGWSDRSKSPGDDRFRRGPARYHARDLCVRVPW